jgi:hypothetical protein
MKKRSTYRLLLQSEERGRNILETAVYALFALAAALIIWQFAEEPAMPTYQIGTAINQELVVDLPS